MNVDMKKCSKFRLTKFIIFSGLLQVFFFSVVANAQNTPMQQNQITELAKQFVKEALSKSSPQSSGIFSESILVGFRKVLDSKGKPSGDSFEDEEQFYPADILGIGFTNKDTVRIFLEEHTDSTDEMELIDFPYKFEPKLYFKNKQEVEETARKFLRNFEKKFDYENYELLSDSMVAGYKDIGIYDAKSYADSFKNVVWNKLSQMLGTAFIHQGRARVFVEEIREDAVKYKTFINFAKQRNGWKFDGYDSRYVCPE